MPHLVYDDSFCAAVESALQAESAVRHMTFASDLPHLHGQQLITQKCCHHQRLLADDWVQEHTFDVALPHINSK